MVKKIDITSDEVKKVANLSRISLDAAEISKATKDLSGILNHFSEIQTVDTQGVETADDVSGLKNVTREDVAEKDGLCTADELLKRVPHMRDGHVQVKAVFNEGKKKIEK